MPKVVDIHSRQPHIAGKIKCLACQNIWVGVAPPGTVDMQCPSCECLRGVWLYVIEPKEPFWLCKDCDGRLFYLLADGRNMCAGCAHYDWPPPISEP